MGPDGLQRLAADDNSRQSVKVGVVIGKVNQASPRGCAIKRLYNGVFFFK